MARSSSSPPRSDRARPPAEPELNPALHKATNALTAVRALDGKVDRVRDALQESVSAGFRTIGEKLEANGRDVQSRFGAIEQRLAQQEATSASRAVQQEATQSTSLAQLESRLTSQVTSLKEGMTATINATEKTLMAWVQATFLPRETARAYVWFPALIIAAVVSSVIGLLIKAGR